MTTATAIAYVADAQVAKVVKRYLRWTGATQKELAAELDIQQSAVSDLMRGQRHWTVDELRTAASFFDIPVAWLFDDPNEIEPARLQAARVFRCTAPSLFAA